MYRFLIPATLLINRFLLLRSNELAGFENTTYHTGIDQYPKVIDNSPQQAIFHSDVLFELPYQSDIALSETPDFHQSDELIPISYRDLFFSKRQITTAATLWAEFLLDVVRLDFSDEKTKALVDVLYDAIIQTGYDGYSAHLDHLQIGHSSFYGPPIMIKKAAEKIGVYPAKFEKVEMLIYTNGNILFNGRVVCTNAEVTHYESNTLSFDNASYMVITGDKFKLFEIPADPAITLYESDIREFYLTPIGWESVRDNKLYVKVYTHEFIGSESELLAMTNETLYQIIQDPNKVKTTFKSDDSFFIWTDKPGNIAKYYGGIGTVNIEKIQDSYYQVSTGVVRVLSAPQRGTIGTIDLSIIKPKDFIILHASDEKILGFMNEDFRNFKARLCTREGYILSEQIFEPGDSVPTFAEVARQYENTFIFQEILQSQHHCSHETKTNLLAHQDGINIAVNGGATHLTFTKYQLKIAAALWAQYLPGAGKFISFDEINKMSKLAYDPLDDFFIRKNQENVIKSEQLDQFINYLYEGIISKHHPDSFLIIGHASFYGTPEVVKQAVEKAKINCFADVTFPYKSEMRIFNNGNIYFNGQMYCTNPDITHYNSQNTFFDNAPWMIIKGDKFKIFEIPYTFENMPFEGFVEDGIHNVWAYLKPAQSFGYRVSDIPEQGTLYIRVSLRDFQGTEAQLFTMSNEIMTSICRDKDKIRSTFKQQTLLSYRIEKSELIDDARYFDLGDTHYERIADNYYQQVTIPVRILSVPKKGSVIIWSENDLVSPGDFLIQGSREEDKYGQLSYLDRNNYHQFEAYLCDQTGQILSQQAFKPGDQLPSYEEVAKQYSLIQDSTSSIADPVSQKTCKTSNQHHQKLETSFTSTLWNFFFPSTGKKSSSDSECDENIELEVHNEEFNVLAPD